MEIDETAAFPEEEGAAVAGDAAAETSGASIDSVRGYVALTARKNALEDELKGIKAEIEAAVPDVLGYLQDNGIQSVNVDGFTVYLYRDIRASFKGTPEAFELIELHEMSDALTTTINAQRAASIVRERIKDLPIGDDIPKWLSDAFSIADNVKTGVRKAGK